MVRIRSVGALRARRLATAVLAAGFVVGAMSACAPEAAPTQVLGEQQVRSPEAAIESAGAVAGTSSSAAGDPATAGGDTAIAAPPEQFDGPPPAAEATPANITTPAVTPSGGTWAVVIGIDDYPGTSHDLRSAALDADDMVAALRSEGVPAEHILSLRNGQVQGDVVGRAVDWLTARASADSTAVFFYAGHVRRLSAATQAIVESDGTTVTDAEVASHLRALQSQRAWIVMAACYGGGFDEVLAPGRILTAAADANSAAYENEGFRRSYLVQYMIRQGLLERAADASVGSAFAFAVQAIKRDYPGREPVQLVSAPASDLALPFGPRPDPGLPPTTTVPPPATTPQTAPPPTRGAGGPPPSSAPPTTGPPTTQCVALVLFRC